VPEQLPAHNAADNQKSDGAECKRGTTHGAGNVVNERNKLQKPWRVDGRRGELTFNRVKELPPEVRRTIGGRVGRRLREMGENLPESIQFPATRSASGEMPFHLNLLR
jgi:hypothetical protein